MIRWRASPARPTSTTLPPRCASRPLTTLGLAFTSSAYKHGPEGERALVERLRPRLREIPVVTTCLAAEAALNKLGITRMALVNPAWFDDDLDALGAGYFEAAGFEVVHHAPCGLKSGQRYVSPPALYDWIETTVAPTGAEAVFVAGNGSAPSASSRRWKNISGSRC